MRRNIFTTLCVLIFSSQIISQETPFFITDSLDFYVKRALKQWEIPGAALLIIKDGSVIVSKGYGLKSLGSDEMVDANTLFLIGSNTKAFTGTVLAMLEHSKKLNLEDKVIDFLPDFKMNDPWVTKELNLIDIVSHRMGLETFQGDFMYWTSDLTEDEVIEKFGMIEPKYDFRTKYGYTNAGYAIAGKVIQKISGISWSEFIKRELFIPLGMNRSTTLSSDFAKSENVALPHTIVDDKAVTLPFENLDNLAPCGSIASSVSDMTNWLLLQLGNGKINDSLIIPAKVIERTRFPQTIVRRAKHPFNITHFTLYALGWELQDYEGKEIISHTGGVNGFLSSVTLIPEVNLGIVILTNNDQNGFFQALKWEIIDAYLSLPYRNYDNFIFRQALLQKSKQDDMISSLRDSVSMNLQPDLPLSRFAGTYEHFTYGSAELSVSNNHLLMHLQHHSNLTGKLEYIGNYRFLCTYSDPLFGIKVFPFEISDNNVKSFKLYVEDFLEFLPYKFIKKTE